jgi:hypothetical protein
MCLDFYYFYDISCFPRSHLARTNRESNELRALTVIWGIDVG